jgi:hypothetical protein
MERGDNETSLSIVKTNIDGVLEFLKINYDEDEGKNTPSEYCCLVLQVSSWNFLHVNRILKIRHMNYQRFFVGYCRTRNSVFGKVVSLFWMVPKKDQKDFFLAAHLPSSSFCAKPFKVMSIVSGLMINIMSEEILFSSSASSDLDSICFSFPTEIDLFRNSPIALHSLLQNLSVEVLKSLVFFRIF